MSITIGFLAWFPWSSMSPIPTVTWVLFDSETKCTLPKRADLLKSIPTSNKPLVDGARLSCKMFYDSHKNLVNDVYLAKCKIRTIISHDSCRRVVAFKKIVHSGKLSCKNLEKWCILLQNFYKVRQDNSPQYWKKKHTSYKNVPQYINFCQKRTHFFNTIVINYQTVHHYIETKE